MERHSTPGNHRNHMATSIAIDDDLKCGICLEQFQDPRSLPCLHTFCLECLQRSLDENSSLKCPVCRAKHELSKERVGLLPVDQCVLQQLPLKRLQQQQKEDTSVDKKCGFCGETETPVAWCSDCGVLICKLCLDLHEKMVYLRGHHIMQRGKDQSEFCIKGAISASGCLRHSGQGLEYLCTHCSEAVCSACLLLGPHKDHQYSTVEEARHNLETKMRGLMDSVVTKKEEFSEYLEKVDKVEGEALEYSEFMTNKVNNVFDSFTASVEAQRNEALQSVSQGVKEIWSQKELVEVSMAQLDSFTRFADHVQKCATDSSYVSMAAHGVKLMERLEKICGDENVLEQKMVAIGSRRLPIELLKLGQPSLKFSHESDIVFVCCSQSTVSGTRGNLSINVSLMVDGFPVISETMYESLRTCC